MNTAPRGIPRRSATCRRASPRSTHPLHAEFTPRQQALARAPHRAPGRRAPRRRAARPPAALRRDHRRLAHRAAGVVRRSAQPDDRAGRRRRAGGQDAQLGRAGRDARPRGLDGERRGRTCCSAYRNILAALDGPAHLRGREARPHASASSPRRRRDLESRARACTSRRRGVLATATVTSASLFDLALIVLAGRAGAAAAPARVLHPQVASRPRRRCGGATCSRRWPRARGWPRDYIRAWRWSSRTRSPTRWRSSSTTCATTSSGLNLGRWDYMASLIHCNLEDPALGAARPQHHPARRAVLPAPAPPAGGHLPPARRAGDRRHDRALPEPRRRRAERARARACSSRTSATRPPASWTAPGPGTRTRTRIAVAQFPAPNQIASAPDARRALPRPAARARPACGRAPSPARARRCAPSIRYRNGVLNGKGASLLDGYMEDLATDRIYRLMIAQRMRHTAARCDPGRRAARPCAHDAGVRLALLRRGARARSWPSCRWAATSARRKYACARRGNSSEAMIRPRLVRSGLTHSSERPAPPRRTTPRRPAMSQADAAPPRSSRAGSTDARWQGIDAATTRPTTSCACAARVHVEHTLARLGAERLWHAAARREPGARAGRADGQPGGAAGARRGCKAIYLSAAGRWRPTPTPPGRCIPTRASTRSTACPAVVRRINHALQRADQIAHLEGTRRPAHWFAPIVADAEAGFGGDLNAFELMKAHDRGRRRRRALRGPARLGEEVRPHGRQGAGADARVRAEAAGRAARGRRAGRADAPRGAHRRQQRHAASPATSTSATARSSPASARPRASSQSAAASTRRSRAASPTRRTPTCCGARPARPIWTRRASSPTAIHARFPGKLLAYNCSPSFNWSKKLDAATHREVPARAGRHGLHVPVRHAGRLPRAQPVACSSWRPAIATSGMTAYARLQDREFDLQSIDGLRGGQAPALRGHRLVRRARRR